MVQFHPPLSGMPLAFALLLLLVEALRCTTRWRAIAEHSRSLVAGVCALSVLAAFLSGYQASSGLGDLSAEVEMELGSHHAWGRMLLIDALLMVALLWVSRIATHGKAVFAALYFVALALFVGMTVWVGSLGGALVFERGLGVRGLTGGATLSSASFEGETNAP